jgi:hypothetical protein
MVRPRPARARRRARRPRAKSDGADLAIVAGLEPAAARARPQDRRTRPYATAANTGSGLPALNGRRPIVLHQFEIRRTGGERAVDFEHVDVARGFDFGATSSRNARNP